MRDKVIVYDGEIRKIGIFFFHLRKKMFTEFDRVVVAAGLNDRLTCLTGSGTKLQDFFSGADLRVIYKLIEKLLAVSRSVLVELIGDRIKYLSELHTTSPSASVYRVHYIIRNEKATLIWSAWLVLLV